MSVSEYENMQDEIETMRSEINRLEGDVEELETKMFEVLQLLKQDRVKEAKKMLQM